MLLRFVIAERDARTGLATGIMSAAYELLRDGSLVPSDERSLQEAVDWVEHHLPVPGRFARKRNVSHRSTHGVAWVKAGATDAVRHLRVIAGLLDRNGLVVETMQTDRPGYVVYEDDWQIVAEPFHGESR